MADRKCVTAMQTDTILKKLITLKSHMGDFTVPCLGAHIHKRLTMSPDLNDSFFFFGFKDVKSAVLPRACTSLRQHLPALNFLWLEEKHVPDGNAEVT